jgi:hypothetical protein
MSNNLFDRPNHIISSRLLSLLPIDFSSIMQLLGIYSFGKQNTRSNWREPVEGLGI